MSKRKKKNIKSSKTFSHTPLSNHKKIGSKLVPPIKTLNVSMIDFERDLLPEHLWLASLAEKFSLEKMHIPFYKFMDVIDEYVPEDKEAIGLISDFAFIPEKRREEFYVNHRELIRDVFCDTIGRILAFYPDNPANWLIKDSEIEKEGSLNPDVELNKLRNLIIKLLPAKDNYAGHVRVMPFGRKLKHGKIFFPKNLDVCDLLAKYPSGCSDDEKYKVQSFTRSLTNTMILTQDTYKNFTWSKYFWRHNYELAICRPYHFQVRGARSVTEEEFPEIEKKIIENSKLIKNYIDILQLKVSCDLYDPTKDEILFGLFARLARLYCLFLDDPNLWGRDLSGIVLRSLVNIAITFSYLAQSGTEQEFNDFKNYGEGQEKLLMLQLQDNYPNETSLEGRNFESIAEELGGFSTEMIEIEFGHWTKKNDRKLAELAGMERFYKLVFSPTSGDLHGNWVSLKRTSLCRCIEPLHRFHRLPTLAEPQLFLNVMIAAQEIMEYCYNIGINVLNYPKLESNLHSFVGDSDSIKK